MRYVCKNPPGGGTKPLSAHRLYGTHNNVKKKMADMQSPFEISGKTKSLGEIIIFRLIAEPTMSADDSNTT